MNLDNLFTRSSKVEREYLALPNILSPRLIVPLQNWHLFAAGLKIQNTASIKNRIIKNIILFLYPVFKLLSPHKVTITPKFEGTIQIALELWDFQKFSAFSFYIGTVGSINRKITILLLDTRGNSPGIIKYPLSKESAVYINNEYQVIRNLNQNRFSNLIVPKNLQTVSAGDKELLFQENIFLGVSRLGNLLNAVIVDASFELSTYTKSTGVSRYLDELLNRAFELPLDEKLSKQIQNTAQIIIDKKVPLVTIHGDFVLYNMQKKESKLALIDWEYSRPGLPLFDLFHFVLQGKYQIEKMNVSNCIEEVFRKKNVDYYKSYLNKLSIAEDIISELFSIYLIDALLFDIRVKSETQVKENHFYKALRLL